MELWLGLDMSTKSSGYSVIDKETGKLIDYGCWKVKQSVDWRDRCVIMGEHLDKKLKEYDIKGIVCEDTIGTPNIKTVKQLSTLQGIIIGVLTSNGHKASFLAPTSWRSKIEGLYTGNREGTTREEMKYKTCKFVNNKYGLNLYYDLEHPNSVKSDDDISDAIGILYSYLFPKEEKAKKTIGKKIKI